jgi:leader peptidase (prepilin peptidase) / N-methyltransferase
VTVGVGLSAVQWEMHAAGFPVAGVALSFALAWASAVDLDRRILPDTLTLGLCLAGLALGWRAGWTFALDSAIGAAAGYGLLAGIAWAYRRWRGRDGLGMGDAKLLAAAGAWTGWQGLPFVLLVGSLSALGLVAISIVFGRRWQAETALPFGPFLSAGLWAVWVFDPVAGLRA